MKLNALRRYVRFKPFDTNDVAGREAERYRLAFWSALSNAVSRIIAMFVMVLGVGLTVPYLGPERFGVWVTVASFAGLLTILDLGAGNALTNRIARCAGGGDQAALRCAISGGLGCLLLISFIVAIGLFGLAGTLPWGRLMNLGDPALVEEARQSAKLFAALFGLSLFTNGIQRVFAGLQRAYEGHLAAALGSLVAVVCLWYSAENNAGIPTLLAVTLGVQTGSILLLLLPLAWRGQFRIRGLVGAVSVEAPHLFKSGGLFFVLQIGTIVGWGGDVLIVSSTLGAAQVAVYGVTQRLFQFVSQPLGVMNSPLWAAYADAHLRGDRAFVRKTLRRSMIATAWLAFAGVTTVTLASPWLLSRWTDGAVEVPAEFVILFAVWTVLETVGNALAMFLNGSFVIREQVIVVVSFACMALPLKFFGAQYYGILAIPIVSAGIYLIVTFGFYGVIFRSRIHELVADHSRGD